MEWNAIELRQLRCRMGWSRAELARRMGCQVTEVMDWEAGRVRPKSEQANNLVHFLNQANSIADSIQRRPVAEFLMTDRGWEQIHESQVIACLANGELQHHSLK